MANPKWWGRVAVYAIPGLVLSTAALGKSVGFGAFVDFLSAWLHMGQEWARWLAASIIVAESIAVLLLVLPRHRRVGLATSALLAFIFLGVVASLHFSGRGLTCPCFGSLPDIPLSATAALDLGLLLLCSAGLLMRATASSDAASAPLAIEQRGSVSSRSAAVLLIGAVLTVCTIGGSLAIGKHRYQSREDRSAVRENATLMLGQIAPPFALPYCLSDGVVTSRSLRGNWTVLCLVRLGCVPCEEQIAALDNAMGAWPAGTRTVLVFRTGSRAGLVADKLERLRHRSTISVLLDSGAAVQQAYGDQPMRWPTTILMDPQGKVRYISAGYLSGRSAATTQLDRWLRPNEAARQPTPNELARADVAAVRLYLADRTSTLGYLSTTQTVMLSFMQPGCEPCDERIQLLDRSGPLLGQALDLRILGAGAATSASEAIASPKHAVLVDHEGRLAKILGARAVPTTYFIKRGRIVGVLGTDVGEAEFAYLLYMLTQPPNRQLDLPAAAQHSQQERAVE